MILLTVSGFFSGSLSIVPRNKKIVIIAGVPPFSCLYTKFNVILSDSVSTTCFSKEYPRMPHPMLSNNKGIFVKVDYWQLDRTTASNSSMLLIITISSLAEIEFRLGMRTGTRRQIGLEKKPDTSAEAVTEECRYIQDSSESLHATNSTQ